MSNEVAQLDVKIKFDDTEASKKLSSFDEKIKNMGKSFSDFGKKMTTFVTLPILGAMGASFKFASDMQESLNKVDVAFGESSGEVKEWANTTLKSYGIAKGTALDMTALFGDMGTALGLVPDEAAKMSMSLTGLAGDLSSFKNIGIDQAQTALKGIFTGETESLKQLGIVMNEATLEAYANAKGMQYNKKEMSQAELVALRYAYVMDASKNSIGDFDRTSEGAANQMRIFSESLKEVGSQFGEVLLPVITPLIAKVNEWMTAFGQLDVSTRTIILVVLGLVAVIGPLMMILGGLIQAWFILQATFMTVILPIVAVIGAIFALGAMLVYAWNNVEGFKEMIMTAWNKILEITKMVFEQYIVPFVQNVLMPAFITVFKAVAEAVMYAFQEIQWLWDTVLWPVLSKIIDFIANTVYPIWYNALEGIWKSVETAFGFIKQLWERSLKPILSGIIDFVSGVFSGNWSKAWEGIKQIVGGVWEGIKLMIKGGLNFMIDGLNSFIRGVNSIKIPDWVPFVGGKSFNIPTIPSFEVGSRYLPSDMLIYAHKGEMIVPASENPYANSGGSVLGGGGITQNVTINSTRPLTPSEVAKQTRNALRSFALEYN